MEQEAAVSVSVEQKELPNGADPEVVGLGVSGSAPVSDGVHTDGDGEHREGSDDSEKDGSVESGYQTQTALGEREGSDQESKDEEKKMSAAQVKSAGKLPSPVTKPRSTYQQRQPRVTPMSYYRYIPITQQSLFYSSPTQPASYMQQPTRSQQQHASEQLSSTNLYIRGLSQRCVDEDLVKMCQQYGRIVSTKAILDKQTNLCKGYGFVDFESPADALKAVQALQASGVLAQFAKQQEQDPTNLYLSNLPRALDEKGLEQLLLQNVPFSSIISTRILRDQSNQSRGVGFARLDSRENCEKAIEVLSGTVLPGSSEPLMVKFADSGSSKRRQQSQGRWRDSTEYVYDTSHVLPQNGLVNSRGLMQQGVLTSPYLQTSSHPISSYQVSGSSQAAWQPTFYMQPANPLASSSNVESVHGLATQVGQLQMATSSGYSQPAPSTQYQITTPHGTQYAQQTPGGWTISHAPISNTPLLQKEHSSEHHSAGDSKPHHIQVIAPDHSAQVDDSTHTAVLYYPNSTWTGK